MRPLAKCIATKASLNESLSKGSEAGRRLGFVRFLQVSHLFVDSPLTVKTEAEKSMSKMPLLAETFCLIPKVVVKVNHNSLT